jgi:hypothetical protein
LRVESTFLITIKIAARRIGIAKAEGQGRKDEFQPPKNGWDKKK